MNIGSVLLRFSHYRMIKSPKKALHASARSHHTNAAAVASNTYGIAIASKNPAKVKAVEGALKQCFPSAAFALHPVPAASGVPDQPIGCDQTLQGAINRVRNASTPHSDTTLTVAIEGGVEWLGTELHCFAWAVVQSNATGAISKARSASFMLPDKIAQLIQQGVELGDADDKVFGRSQSGQGSGTVGKLSGGLITRAAYYEHAMVLALLPFMNQELYPQYVMQSQGQGQGQSG